MAKKPKTKPAEGKGRPEISDEQLWDWLEDDLKPFLKQGHSLWYAINKAGLEAHKTTIYEKSKSDSDFSEKITQYQSHLTELNNSVIYKIIESVHTRYLESDKAPVTTEEVRIISLVAEKHRTSQTHWVNRTETAEADKRDLGKIIERPTIQIIKPEGVEDDDNEDNPASDSNEANAEAVEGVADAEQPNDE